MSQFTDYSPPLREAKVGTWSMDYGGTMLTSFLSSLPSLFYIAQGHLPKESTYSGLGSLPSVNNNDSSSIDVPSF